MGNGLWQKTWINARALKYLHLIFFSLFISDFQSTIHKSENNGGTQQQLLLPEILIPSKSDGRRSQCSTFIITNPIEGLAAEAPTDLW